MRTDLLSEYKLDCIKKYRQGLSVLDVGSGYGHYSAWLAAQNPELAITAIDLVDAQETPGFTYKKMDLEQALDFIEGQFSTVMAFDVIEHISNVDHLLQELLRITTQGGVLIGSVPHDKDEFLPAYNLTFKHRSDVTHKRYYTEDGLKKALENAGFAEIKIIPFGSISPQIIAEFFPSIIRLPLKKLIGFFRRIGFVNAQRLKSDLFFMAKKL